MSGGGGDEVGRSGEGCEPTISRVSRKGKLSSRSSSARRRRCVELRLLRSSGEVDRGSDRRGSLKRGRVVEEARAPASREMHGSASVIGRRRAMEDAVALAPAFAGEGVLPEYDFFGVFDGHGGAGVAEACRERMHVVLAEEVGRRRPPPSAKEDREEEARWREALAACFARVDGEVSAWASAGATGGGLEDTVGSTAVVAVVGRRIVVVANCGDSRAVLSRGGVALPLSSDHKPDRPDELQRVEAAGGRVINWNGYRISGVLATSRSIGDYYLKPYVTSEPEVTAVERTDEDEFLILASDGLWDVVSNDTACKLVRNCLTGRIAAMFPDLVAASTAAEAAALLAEVALLSGSEDNVSVVVVELKRLSK